ncbi:MAG: DUF11 domain-containing protein, partial [Burkholderiaceae bacterium]|nr:DUF11 domain-containing protein [Burkholderiaceae bacterium]
QSPIANRQSPIANRQSPIANRQSPIANRQSPIANRQSPIPRIAPSVFFRLDHLKSAALRFSSNSPSLRKLALKNLAGFCFAATVSVPVLAQQKPIISCDTDPAIFHTGIADDGLGNYLSSNGVLPNGTPDAHWQYAFTGGSANPTAHQLPSTLTLGWGPTTATSYTGTAFAPLVGNAKWIRSPTGAQGTVWYRYVFDLADSVHPSAFNLPVTLRQDDFLYHIWVNDTDNFQIPPLGYTTMSVTSQATLNTGWQTGENQIVVATYDDNALSGFLLYTGTSICTEKLSVTKTTTQSTAVSANQTNIPFEIVVANKGAAFPAGAVLNDALPAGLASGTWTCSNNGTTATCPAASGVLPISNLALGALPAGSSLRFNILANAQSAANLLSIANIENAATLMLPQSFVAKDVCLDAHNASANACMASASISVLAAPLASAVPVFDRWAYGLTGLGVLALAAVATRHKRVMR